MVKKKILNNLKKSLGEFLKTPEIRDIPWEDCVRATAQHYDFDEKWIEKQLETEY